MIKKQFIIRVHLGIMSITMCTSCSKPTETKEEFIQKGIIMSDTLLKSVDRQLKDAESAVDSAIKLGAFLPPPPTLSTPSASHSLPPSHQK